MAVEYRARSLGTALRYRGREGMWSWILHRATGLGVLLFLVMHVIDTGIIIYRHPLFRLGELFIFFGVLYHAANGLRIIVQDFWPYVMQRQRQLTMAVAVVVVLAMLPITWIMVAPMLGLAEEPGVDRHEARCLEQPDAPACLGESSVPAAEVAP